MAELRRDLRKVCAAVNDEPRRPLRGLWFIDETQVHKDIVLGGIEQATGQCFARIVPDRTSATMIPVIEAHVGRCSEIQTDCHASYKPLAEYKRQFWKHTRVKHSKRVYKCPITGACTNTVEGWWRALKNAFSVQGKHDLEGFVAEYVFKRNARPQDPFAAILQAIGKHRPPGADGTYRRR